MRVYAYKLLPFDLARLHYVQADKDEQEATYGYGCYKDERTKHLVCEAGKFCLEIRYRR